MYYYLKIKIIFYRFPLENKIMLKKWLNNIGVPNWKPSETDGICSNHFEYYNINQIENNDIELYNYDYELQNHAIPEIKPKISKVCKQLISENIVSARPN